MYRAIILSLALFSLFLIAGLAHAGDHGRCHRGWRASHGGGLFGWRNYSAEERRNFPTCYGGYERYFGGFHANYFRDFPGDHDGLNNDRYGYGSGWAW